MKPCDLLLFRPTGFWGRLVAWGTRAAYCHVGMVARFGGDWFLLEYREFLGFRATPMREVVGDFDVYRMKSPVADVVPIIDAMFRDPCESYGYWHAVMTFISRWLPARWFQHECHRHAPHCSEAVCRAFRMGIGVDLVPNVPDWKTVPGDIATSILLEKVDS